MAITDIFIKRPVLATVISILIFGFGLRSLGELQLREFPKMEIGVIRVNTSYSGADADTIQSFITNPVERTIASADGIDYVTSDTSHGSSSVNAYIKLGYNIDKVFTDIMSKVAEIRSVLPEEADSPVISKSSGHRMAMMYLSLNSDLMNPQQITDYFQKVMRPKFETIEGVAEAQVFGGSSFALRIWLDPNRMAALKIASAELLQALRSNQYLARAGKIEGHYIDLNIKAETDVIHFEDLDNLVIRNDGHEVVRLKDIARTELGATSYNHNVSFNGKKAVFIAIETSPTANPLSVIKRVRQELPDMTKQFPPSLNLEVVVDKTEFIEKAISEVLHTILEATLIVLFVIFLFIGNIRAVLIPMVTVPLSLIGVASFMLAMGYSLNFLTLLAMVLAIGLVVDDAIVVLENIHRHLQQGEPRLSAALNGAREISVPVVSMTLTLAAVYAPIGFVGGITGALFKEFAFTLAGCVILSGIIALSLSPMMCSKILNVEATNWFEARIHLLFDGFRHFYYRVLSRTIEWRKLTFILIVGCFGIIYLCLNTLPKELAPNEDEGFIFVSAQAPQYANNRYVTHYTELFDDIYRQFPEIKHTFTVNQTKSAFSGIVLKDWDERARTPQELQPALQAAMNQNPGLMAYAIAPGPLPTPGGSTPVQFIVSSTLSQERLAELADSLKQALNQTGIFAHIDHDLVFNKPSLKLSVNRDKAALLGVRMQQIAEALSTYYADGAINRMQVNGKSYDIITQADHNFRLTPENIKSIYIKTSSDDMVPLSAIISLQSHVESSNIHKFQQLNAVTLSGVPAPGHSLEEALNTVKSTAQALSPSGTNFDYSGESRRFIQEGHTLQLTFSLALAVIFLVLAAQFESFVTPFIILISVPLSLCGALTFLWVFQHWPFLKSFHSASTLNIYSEIGLISLIGLISKHGILMVEFSNQLLSQGLSVKEAILKSASTRLRPILMTTLAMVLGVMPLVLAQGPGSISRVSIGLVLASGLSFGTLLTLFVVPSVYYMIRSAHLLQFSIATGLLVLWGSLGHALVYQTLPWQMLFWLALAMIGATGFIHRKLFAVSHETILSH